MIERPPTDPADHAEEFAHEWADRLDEYCAVRMDELGIPRDRIGSSDHERRFGWRAFFPDEREAGGLSPGGRINVDSGVLNPGWHAEVIGPEASRACAWARARLRDRIDAVIAHEYEEHQGGSHEYAVEHAPQTVLPIHERVRTLLDWLRRGEPSTRGGGSSPSR